MRLLTSAASYVLRILWSYSFFDLITIKLGAPITGVCFTWTIPDDGYFISCQSIGIQQRFKYVVVGNFSYPRIGIKVKTILNGIDHHPFDCSFTVDHFKGCVAKIYVKMSATEDIGALWIVITEYVICTVLRDRDVEVVFGKFKIVANCFKSSWFYLPNGTTISIAGKSVSSIRYGQVSIKECLNGLE